MMMEKYLESLSYELRFLPKEEREEVISDYREHFGFALEAGKTEEDVIQSLGTPKNVAQEYKTQKRVHVAISAPNLKSVAGAVGSVAVSGVYNALVLAPLYFGGVLALIIVYIAAAAAALASITGFAALIGNAWILQYVNASFGFTNLMMILMFTATLAAGIAVFVLGRIFARWFFKSMAQLTGFLHGKTKQKVGEAA